MLVTQESSGRQPQCYFRVVLFAQHLKGCLMLHYLLTPIERFQLLLRKRNRKKLEFYSHWWQELISASFGMYLGGRSFLFCNLLTAICECKHYLYDADDLDLGRHAR